MAGIGFGGRTGQSRGGMSSFQRGPGPRSFIGDQAGAFDPLSFYDDMIARQKNLYSWKQEQDMAMQDKLRRKAQLANAMQSAPRSGYNEAMAQARAQADAESLIRNRRIQDAERTRQDLLFKSQSEPNYGQYMQSSAQTFAHMLPAYQMHGIDVMGGRPTGWDQYAALAKAGAAQSAAAEGQAGQNLRQMHRFNLTPQQMQSWMQRGR